MLNRLHQRYTKQVGCPAPAPDLTSYWCIYRSKTFHLYWNQCRLVRGYTPVDLQHGSAPIRADHHGDTVWNTSTQKPATQGCDVNVSIPTSDGWPTLQDDTRDVVINVIHISIARNGLVGMTERVENSTHNWLNQNDKQKNGALT